MASKVLEKSKKSRIMSSRVLKETKNKTFKTFKRIVLKIHAAKIHIFLNTQLLI